MKNTLLLKYFLFSLLAISIAQRSFAQSKLADKAEDRPAIGIFGGLAANFSVANFSALNGVPECNANYNAGSGIGPVFGVFYDLPLSQNLSLSLRGVYNQYGQKLASNEVFQLAIGGVETPATIEHSITAHLGMIGFQPLLNYMIIPGFSIGVGGELGFVIDHSFEQVETLVQPSSKGVFENGFRTRNQQSGSIPDANSIIGSVICGVSYQLPLNANKSLQAIPQVYFSYGITPIAKDLSWNTSALRAGIGIKYTLPEKAIEKPAEPLKDTIIPIPQKPDAPIASITASGVESSGEESPVATVHVEEIASTRMTPLLPYVFFDDHTAVLPSRYFQLTKKESADFSEAMLKDLDPLGISHHVLNIIGKRLQDHPEIIVTVTGLTLKQGNNGISKELASARANTIVNYFDSVWGIKREKFIAKVRQVDDRSYNLLDSDVLVELNRVEILSNALTSLPIAAYDTVKLATPPSLRFRPTVYYSGQIRNWKVITSQKNLVLKTFEGNGLPPSSLDWVFANDPKTMPEFPGIIDYSFIVRGESDEEVHVEGKLSVEQLTLRKKKIERIADREIEKYNLLLFDFHSAEVSDANKAIIERIIKPRIQKNSVVMITGHTDRTGDNVLNQGLSLERAKNTARILQAPKTGIMGLGELPLLLDNSLPEARYLCRTVDVVISTPTENQ